MKLNKNEEKIMNWFKEHPDADISVYAWMEIANCGWATAWTALNMLCRMGLLEREKMQNPDKDDNRCKRYFYKEVR